MRPELYRIAQEVTDEVLGEGTYARLHADNHQPGIRRVVLQKQYGRNKPVDIPTPVRKINEIHAFVSVDPADDTEGIIAAYIGGAWMPLVAADAERVHSLMPLAERTAQETGRPVRLVKFSTREVLRTIHPEPPA